MRLNLITPPAAEPINVTQVEAQMRLQLGDIDFLGETGPVGLFISAVRQKAEAVTRRALVTQVWELVLDGFPRGRDPLEVPLPPLQSVESITYVDTTGAAQTLDASLYRVESDSAPNCQPGQILPAYGQQWPATLDDVGVVRVRFTAGYGTVDAVPEAIKQWMLINVANLYENRESETVANGKLTMVDLSTLADSLLADLRVYGW
ncbi:hypothetical protein KP003_16665 [Geomonas nitrogeniifigens]|uniref:head-tail connector protein n=1 Tax=Geomonas diazotrophica TaxID=2843197 RepID=UPI001C2CB902|nr:hypothetical protein [Geomonas nitrogeniifigens]QXE85974.1 hypothetical protein KP003_16665 [Geomonas nitrogeniifigens]